MAVVFLHLSKNSTIIYKYCRKSCGLHTTIPALDQAGHMLANNRISLIIRLDLLEKNKTSNTIRGQTFIGQKAYSKCYSLELV